MRNAQTAAETYLVDNNGVYTGMDVNDIQAIEPALEQFLDARWTVASTADTYAITITSPEVDAAQDFTVTRAANGVITRTCDTDGTGGCPSTGTW